ncbi:hypothetical protein OB2597_19841 [Pseudooceanicola batsensis HTCC2597]|uniref:Uncharacterized protein n=1 Tax=Pseudooceanicola batsensis (strain ATCC BAA-863 / DSM 15984 / KCTC 12145 / HTCC2597) TaxID=252305 RepID=A3U0S8_PSEBH|nr:hypothetical protein [Pseudooceanicola batsensis]EAQ02369.1 hypothetical protein OB2597_19841 [Pseudooceanicola batsensis HTCC2597]
MAELPQKFAALSEWDAWCLATETERNARRVKSSFEDISAFALAMEPHVEEICAHIDAAQAEGDLDAPTLNLFYLLLSLAEVAPAIESYDPEVEVVDGYESKLFAPEERHPLRPAI